MIVSFTFSCPVNNGICQVSYDFSGYSTGTGGFKVFVDANGDYSNADDEWAPIGPNAQTFGSNTEGAGACDGAQHTIEFMVQPGCLLYIDNGVTDCLLDPPPTPIRESTWGRIKALYDRP